MLKMALRRRAKERKRLRGGAVVLDELNFALDHLGVDVWLDFAESFMQEGDVVLVVCVGSRGLSRRAGASTQMRPC